MRFYAGAALVVFLALVQTSALPLVPLFGVTPNLVLLTLVAWTLARGLEDALPLYLVGGVTLGLFEGELTGLPVIGMGVVALLALAYEARIVHWDLLVGLAVAALGGAAYDVIHLAAYALTGERVLWLDAALRVLLPAAVIHAALFPLFFWTARGLIPSRPVGAI